ncbi:MAG: hypothetical protein ACI8SJ_000711 [Shewanella sp.]|jgi:hypothetical protein
MASVAVIVSSLPPAYAVLPSKVYMMAAENVVTALRLLFGVAKVIAEVY